MKPNRKGSGPSSRFAERTSRPLRAKKKEYKEEVDSRIQQELAKESKVNERLAQIDAEEQAKEAKANERLAELDAAVKVYRDKGKDFFGGWHQEGQRASQESGWRKGRLSPSTLASISEAAQKKRDSLRSTLASIAGETQKARDDLDKRYKAIDERIALVQKEISEASLKITGLTTGGQSRPIT